MSCNKTETILLDYFYNELPEEEHAGYEQHLESCPDCREALEELKLTSQALGTWEVPDPKLNMVFVTERHSLIDRIRELLPSAEIFKKRPFASFAYGFAALFLLLSFTNFELSYDRSEGAFSVSTSIFGKDDAGTDAGYEVMNRQLMQTQSQILDLVREVINEREERQHEQTLRIINQTVREMASTWEIQRERDLRDMGMTLNVLRDMADENNQYINNNRSMLMDVATTVGVELKK